MRAALVPLAALALVTTVLAGTTWGAAESGTLLVGYAPEDHDAAMLAIKAAGGSVRRTSAELSFAVVDTQDRARFEQVARLSGVFDYVEDDSAMRVDGAQWNGAQWNGAQWNGAQWNGAQWNGAQWNGAQWNGAQWNAFTWSWRMSDETHWRHAVRSDPALVWQWGTWAIDAPDAWRTSTGSRDTTLCVLDSGVAWDHRDLAPNMWTGPFGEHGWNAITPGASAYDDAGHGTHIAGIAAAAVGDGYGVAGVGNARIMAVKVLDATGAGRESDLAFGMVWCALQGADVAVMALSVTERGPTLERAFAYAAARDVLMLASAGNDGPCADCVNYPATDPHVMGVGAVDGDLVAAPFSNQGPEVDLTAPGVDVLGPFPGGTFVFGSGTSQAVAFAAGMASLLRGAEPTLSAGDTARLLEASATDLDAVGKDQTTGAGLLDARDGLEAALAS